MSVAPVTRRETREPDPVLHRPQPERRLGTVPAGASNPPETPAEEQGGIAAEAAKAAVAYRAQMYGEIGVGNRTAKFAGEMRFGGINPGTTLADRSFTSRSPARGNFGIDEFSRTDRRGQLARSTMVSSQANFNYGRQVAAAENLPKSEIRFETPRGTGPTRRDVDMRRPGPGGTTIDTEIKAASDVKGKQLAKDIGAARSGVRVDYVFTDNPAGTARGPSPAAQSKLANAASNTGGNITSSYRPDIAPSSATIKAVETSSVASKAVRGVGKVAAPVGVVMDTVAIGSALQKDGGTFGKNTKVAVAGAAGGWAGAAGGAVAGAKVGALVGLVGGPAGAAVGGVVGGIVGGIAGGIGGASIGEKLGKLW